MIYKAVENKQFEESTYSLAPYLLTGDQFPINTDFQNSPGTPNPDKIQLCPWHLLV